MSTIVNSPTPSGDSGGFGFLLGIIALIMIGAILFYYGLPAIRQMGTPQITTPNQVVIPSKVDVNVTNK